MKGANSEVKTPLAVVGRLVKLTIWLVCTLAGAIQSAGADFALGVGLDAYRELCSCAYTVLVIWSCTCVLPLTARLHQGLYDASEVSPGQTFLRPRRTNSSFPFRLLSVPVLPHHQFPDPFITQGEEMFQGLLNFGVAVPYFVTAFTIALSLHYAGRKRGAKGPSSRSCYSIKRRLLLTFHCHRHV